MHVAHIQLQVCSIQLYELWALGWRHCLVSGCFVSSWPGPGGGIIEHELGADRKCSVRPAERSERSRNLPEYRQTLCVCHTARSVYPNAVVTFDLIGRWDGEGASCSSQQILTLTHKTSLLFAHGSWSETWELNQLLRANGSFLITCLHQPIRNQQACALHTWSCSLYSHTDTHKHTSAYSAVLSKQQHHCKKTIN